MCSNQRFTSSIPWVTAWNWRVTSSKAQVRKLNAGAARLKERIAKSKAQAEVMKSQVK